MRRPSESAEGLFIRQLESPARRRGLWRLARWLPLALLPQMGTCVSQLQDLLRQIGLDPCWLDGSCVTTLALGEECGM